MKNRYPKYKSSNLLSFNEVPNHWKKSRIKYLGFMYGGLTGKSGDDFRKNEDDPSNKPFIPFTNICNNTYILKDELKLVSISENDNQNKVEKDDIFFMMTSETQEDVGKTSVLKEDLGEVYLNTFCKGFRVTDRSVNPYFLNYLLYGNSYRQLLSIEGNGFTRVNLRQDRVNDFIVFIPTLHEQEQIVKYLDERTTQIDNLISITKNKIKTLKEKRTKLINTVITKGLNKKVELKYSGIEWIGEIPKHWEVGKLKYFSKHITDGSHFSPSLEDEGRFYISVTDITKENSIDFQNCKKINTKSFEDLERNGCRPNKGDILLTKDGTIGRGTIVEFNDFVILSSLGLIRLKEGQSNKYFLFYLLSGLNVEQMYSHIRGSGITRLTIKLINDLLVVVPPLEEQEQIVIYLDTQTTQIDNLISIEKKRIETLKEYRQSLISEVVTGKLKVCKDEFSQKINRPILQMN